jgi:hypothetical protein
MSSVIQNQSPTMPKLQMANQISPKPKMPKSPAAGAYDTCVRDPELAPSMLGTGWTFATSETDQFSQYPKYLQVLAT